MRRYSSPIETSSAAVVSTTALICGPASVAGTATVEAMRVARSATRLLRVLRAGAPEGPSGVPPEAIFPPEICTNICAKTGQQSSFKRLPNLEKACVSCLGMSWRRNELITLTLPKSGVARTVCYNTLIVLFSLRRIPKRATNKQSLQLSLIHI